MTVSTEPRPGQPASQSPGPSWGLGQWAARVFVALLIYTLFVAVWRLRDALLLSFLAAIVAIVLQMPVRRLEKLGFSRGLSILITLGVTLIVISLLIILIAPVFVQQVADLVDDLPNLFDSARDEYDQQAEANNWLPDIDWNEVTEGDYSDFFLGQAGNISRSVFPFLSSVGGALTSTFFMFIIAAFFIADPGNYLQGALTLIPRDYRPRALEIFEKLTHMLQRWFIGQLISMTTSGLIITFMTGVIFGLPNAVALGVIAGVMEFIPNLGAFIAVIPAIIITLAEKDPLLVPVVIAGYIIAQQIQSNVIMPRIMSRQISIPAASILIAQIIAATLFGFLGILLALPLAIVVMVLVREIYVFDVLNAEPARIEQHVRPDGSTYAVVSATPYRPENLTPGEAARRVAVGEALFDRAPGEVVEIITPPSPALEESVRRQQVVWVAILAVVVAQGLGLMRDLLRRDAR